MALTTDDLVAAVRRLAFLPDAGGLSDTDLLAMADAELSTLVGELVKDAREEYWVSVEDTALSSALTYRLPRRALDRTVRSVKLLDQDGREIPATEIDAAAPWSLSTDTFVPVYYFRGDFICFRQTPPSGWSLRVAYLRRPSQLVATTACAAILKANDTTHLDCTGSAGSIAAGGRYVDIVRGDAPFDHLYVDLQVKSVTTDVYELDASTPIVVSDFVSRASIPNARQDYLCLRDQTCYPPLSTSEFPVLVAATARRALEEVGDRGGAALAESTMQARLKASRGMIQPRNEQGSRAIINTSSRLRGGGGFGRRWR